jgi:Skp family chaperone for outer membrane proteins
MSPEKDKPKTRPLASIDSMQVDLKDKYPQISEPQMIIELFRSISNQIAINNGLVMAFIEDQKNYRTDREKKELEKLVTTDEKINEIVNKRFEGWTYIRERVLPAVYVAIILAVLKKLGII